MLKNLFLKQDHHLLKKKVLIRHDLHLHLEALAPRLHQDQHLRLEVVATLRHQSQLPHLEAVVLRIHHAIRLLEAVVIHHDLAQVEVEGIVAVVIVANLVEVGCVEKE